MKKTILLISVCLTQLIQLSAQNFQSVYKVGGTGYEYAEDFARDLNGNTIAAGSFQYSVDFDPGAGSTILTENGNTGNSDGFIASYSTAGALNWVVNLGSTMGESIFAVDTDTLGNIYAAGYFNSSFDCDPGSGVTTLNTAGASDWFVVKFNSAGVFQWGTAWGNIGQQSDVPKSIRVKSGFVYVGGYSQNATNITQPTFGVFDANSGFIMLLGVCNATDQGVINDIELDPAGNIFITGGFRGTTDFDINLSVANSVSAGADDVFIAKYSPYPNMNLDWAKTIGGPFTDQAYGIDVDQYRVFITGSYQGTIDADPNAGITNLTATGTANGFVMHLDMSGNLMWASSMLPGAGTDLCNPVAGIKIGPGSTAVYVGGNYTGSLDLDMGTGTHTITAASTNNDAFWVKYDISGNFVEAHTVEGNNTIQSINEIIPVSASEFFAYGEFEGNFTNFDPGNSNTMLNASGRDVFVSRYASCMPSASSITASICNGSSYTFGSQILNTAGTYTDTLGAASGCDSIVTLTLAVVSPNAATVVAGDTIYALGLGAYQWIDCATGTAIAGANAVSFTPVVNGTYAVIVTDAGCSDTSSCSAIVLSLEELNLFSNPIAVYPNPANDVLNIEIHSGEINAVEIFDITGALVKSISNTNGNLVKINTGEIPSGMYFVRVKSGNEISVMKFTKE